ncbi:hypothetical protein [Gilliamella apicola]|uniref:Uncharacterized protein n=1 Tax=Gilliamella apicola TaxID=1196095 RepID=A0A2V4DY09_9GAMM|nr:hypothetical protein [Gilliamella apicola]PXZ04379.1 hypothetical protein DKK79_08450 [Gilliamella apicola]
MTNEQVIERLKQGNWYVECYAYSETYTLLCACDDAGIKWRTSVKATDFIPKALDLLEIGCRTAGRVFHAPYNHIVEKMDMKTSPTGSLMQ